MTDSSVPTRPLNLQGRWRTYTQADGLAALHVEHIAEDHDGCLWFATCSGGVSRFDGAAFHTFTAHDGLASDLVYAALCDRQGRVWFGTMDQGVCWYEEGAFHRFGEDAWCAHGSCLFLFADSQDRVWFAGDNGVGYWDGHRLRDLSAAYAQTCGHPPRFVWGIVEDTAGALWLGGTELVRWDCTRFWRLGAVAGVEPADGGGGGVYAVARDGDGVLWVGKGLELWRLEGTRFVAVAVALGGSVRKLQTDRAGKLWVCSQGGGALVRDREGFLAVTVADGLCHAQVNSLYEDCEGQYWFATWGGGVSCLDPHGCHAPPRAAQSDAGQAWSLVTDRGAVRWSTFRRCFETWGGEVGLGGWEGELAAEEGLRLDTNSWLPPVLAADGVGGLWLGLSSGLYRCQGRACERVYPLDGTGFDPVSALAVDARGRLCFGCHRGLGGPWELVRWDGQEFRRLHVDDQIGFPKAMLPRADGSLWLGLGPSQAQGPGAGLARWGADGKMTRWRVADGLADNRVMDLTEDAQGALWIATLGGLSRFDGTSFHSFTRADGLPTHHLLCLCFDCQGRLWLGTEGALAVFDGQVFQYQWLQELGSVHDLLEDAEGTLWLATDEGVRRYRPQHRRPGVRVERGLADQEHARPTVMPMSTSAPQVQFEYRSLSLRTPPEETVYRYRLQGHDTGWQAPTRSRWALYGRLPVGEYEFQVQAVDRDLNYSEPATVQLTVEPDPHLEGLNRALSAAGSAGEFVGESPAIRRLLAQLQQAALTDATVLILGETGTGKGLAARTLHALSARQRGPFVTVSCGALPEGLVESELFGHERGAFTGAHQRQLGKVEVARNGTLLLDEIGDLPLAAQAKLLRLLEEGTFERVGGSAELRCQARIVAATNRELEQMVADGRFRQDLYYRLQVLLLRLPPLRERREDIELLALYFLRRQAAHLHKLELERLSPETLALLQAHAWPGNVRELQHVVERGVIVASGPELRPEDLVLGAPAPTATQADRLVPLAEHERRYLQQVLEHTGGVIHGPRGAARLLGVPPATLYGRMHKLGIQHP